MFISELSKIWSCSFQNLKEENTGRIKSFNGKDKSILHVHEKVPIRRAVIPGYAFPLPSTLFVCTSKGSHVDIAFG